MAKSVGILSRTRFYLSCKTKLMLYYTLLYPYITYCNSTWSSAYVSNLNIIYYLQKRALRAVTNSDYRAHTAPLFSKLKILDIFQINTLDIAKFMASGISRRRRMLRPNIAVYFCLVVVDWLVSRQLRFLLAIGFFLLYLFHIPSLTNVQRSSSFKLDVALAKCQRATIQNEY